MNPALVIDFVQKTFRAYDYSLFGKTNTCIINNEPIFYKDIEIDSTKKNEQVPEIINNRALQFFESKLNLKLNQDTEFSHFHTKRI